MHKNQDYEVSNLIECHGNFADSAYVSRIETVYSHNEQPKQILEARFIHVFEFCLDFFECSN